MSHDGSYSGNAHIEPKAFRFPPLATPERTFLDVRFVPMTSFRAAKKNRALASSNC